MDYLKKRETLNQQERHERFEVIKYIFKFEKVPQPNHTLPQKMPSGVDEDIGRRPLEEFMVLFDLSDKDY